MIRSLAAVAKSKLAIAATTVVLTAGGGVGAKTAITGSPNPFVWGQQVKRHVLSCKRELAPGQHGIGRCVSAFARRHGVQERGERSRSKSVSDCKQNLPAGHHGIGRCVRGSHGSSRPRGKHEQDEHSPPVRP